MLVNTGSDLYANGPSALPVGQWSHLAMTYDSTTLRVYVNGTEVATRSRSGTIATTAGALRIGGNEIWGEYFSGLIDEVRVYSTALTAAQIQTDMTTPVAPTGPPDTQAPTAPLGLTANGGIGRVDLSWTASTDNVGVTGYDVHGSTTAGFTPAAGNRIGQTTATTYADTGRAPGTYYYRVVAKDAAGNSTASVEESAVVTADTTPPSVSVTAPTARGDGEQARSPSAPRQPTTSASRRSSSGSTGSTSARPTRPPPTPRRGTPRGPPAVPTPSRPSRPTPPPTSEPPSPVGVTVGQPPPPPPPTAWWAPGRSTPEAAPRRWTPHRPGTTALSERHLGRGQHRRGPVLRRGQRLGHRGRTRPSWTSAAVDA